MERSISERSEIHIKNLIADAQRNSTDFKRTTPAEQSIGQNVEAFLAFKKSQADAGERSLGRVDCLRLHLNHFQGWIGAEKPVAEIGAVVVRQYYQSTSWAKRGKAPTAATMLATCLRVSASSSGGSRNRM